MSEFPVITICGSMRYFQEMREAAERYTGMGYIVLMPFVTVVTNTKELAEQKEMLDKMHFEKIRMASAILVIGEHRGESTLREIAFAINAGKQVLTG